MNFNGRIDDGGKCISLCCEPINNRPATQFDILAKDTMEKFIKRRNNIIYESKNMERRNSKRVFTAGCSRCVNYQKRAWESDGLIHYINLSMYPAPCQCKCIYCGIYRGEKGKLDDSAEKAYLKLFDLLDYIKNSGRIAPDVRWQVSSEEITIHPFKDKILNIIGNQAAIFYTNCFKYYEKIAQNLRNNPYSAISLSIDAGLPKTWHKIKGFDNFNEVTSNLVKYYNECTRPGQITLKYIVLPGMNDNLEDYLSVIEIMKVLKVSHLTISRDTNKKYNNNFTEKQALIGASAYLAALCRKNNLTNDMFTFSPSEREEVMIIANELLRTGQV